MIENETMVFEIASCIKEIAQKNGLRYYFKASFDKANRTSIASFRGPGMEKGLEILGKAKRQLGLKIVTDIHEAWQAQPVSEVADMIQIPAFLCRQTDLLTAAARTGKTVHVKKAQFLAPWDMENVVRKLEEAGNHSICLCERGTSFGYNQLVVDMTSIMEMKKLGYPVIFDATHSVQKPGGNGTSTGGNRAHVEYLAKAAVAAGADGLFVETHPDPEHACSDGPNMVPLADMDALIRKVLRIYSCVKEEGIAL